jgi:hypothetical protein
VVETQTTGFWVAPFLARLPTPPPSWRHQQREIAEVVDLHAAGYTKTRTETLDLDPPVVCILAANPDPARDRSSPASDATA